MRLFSRHRGRLAAAGASVAMALLLAGCAVGRSQPDFGKFAFIYTDCVQKSGGTVSSFKVQPTTGSAYAFDDFKSETAYSEEQTASMRACYAARVAALN